MMRQSGREVPLPRSHGVEIVAPKVKQNCFALLNAFLRKLGQCSEAPDAIHRSPDLCVMGPACPGCSACPGCPASVRMPRFLV